MGFYPCSHCVRVTLLPAFYPETDEYPPQLNLDGQPNPLVRLAEALLCFFLHWPMEVWKRQYRSLMAMYTQTARVETCERRPSHQSTLRRLRQSWQRSITEMQCAGE